MSVSLSGPVQSCAATFQRATARARAAVQVSVSVQVRTADGRNKTSDKSDETRDAPPPTARRSHDCVWMDTVAVSISIGIGIQPGDCAAQPISSPSVRWLGYAGASKFSQWAGPVPSSAPPGRQIFHGVSVLYTALRDSLRPW